MRNMGQRWRPAKKGKLTVPPLWRTGMPSPGEQLLAKLTATSR
jgi:hypothetical protein